MKTATLTWDDFFAFGGDSGDEGDDPPRIVTPGPRPTRPKASVEDDEDDDDQDDHIPNAKDRRIAKLSRENNRRRIEARDLKQSLEEKDSEVEDLRKELKKAEKLQSSFDTLKKDVEDKEEIVRRFAIRQAIANDAVQNEKGESVPRTWYDVAMVESLLDKGNLAIDTNDFSVGGLEDQLKAIAEQKPFLVKNSASSESTTPPSRQNPSGKAPSSSATGNRDQERSSDKEQMLADFPALKNAI